MSCDSERPRGLWSGAEAPVGAAGSGGGAAAFSWPSGGSMGSAALPGTQQLDQLPESPFLEIHGDLGYCSAKKWA